MASLRWLSSPFVAIALACLSLLLAGFIHSIPPRAVDAASFFVSHNGYTLESPLKVEGVDVGATLRTLLQSVNSLQQTVAQQQIDIDELKRRNFHLEQQLGNATLLFNTNVAALNDTDVQLNLRADDTDAALAALTTRIDAALNSLQLSIAGVNATTNTQGSTLQQHLTQLSDLHGVDVGLQANVSALVARVSAAEQLTPSGSALVSAVLSLQNQAAQALVNDTALAARVAAAESLTVGSSPLVTKVLSLDASSTLYASQITQLQAANVSVQAAAAALAGHVSTAETTIVTLQAANASAVSQITQLQNIASSTSSSVQQLTNVTNLLYTNYTTLVTRVSISASAGMISGYSGATTPTGWLLCDGSSYSTSNATYADLFAAIQYTFGGSGSSFSVPDLRGRTLIGSGTASAAAGATAHARGSMGGEETHTLTVAESPPTGVQIAGSNGAAFYIPYVCGGNALPSGVMLGGGCGGYNNGFISGVTSGGGGAHNNMMVRR